MNFLDAPRRWFGAAPSSCSPGQVFAELPGRKEVQERRFNFQAVLLGAAPSGQLFLKRGMASKNPISKTVAQLRCRCCKCCRRGTRCVPIIGFNPICSMLICVATFVGLPRDLMRTHLLPGPCPECVNDVALVGGTVTPPKRSEGAPSAAES